MKLYRGIKTNSFRLRTPEEERGFQEKWRKILELREKGKFEYPEHFNKEVIELHDQARLSYQHFTDNREIAERYAKNEEGILIEITVPIAEVLEYFTLEFQNYSKRKEQFEITYTVSSDILADKQEEWQLKLTSFR